VRDIPRSTFAHQDEARFIPLSAGNGELILLTYLRGPKGLSKGDFIALANVRTCNVC